MAAAATRYILIRQVAALNSSPRVQMTSDIIDFHGALDEAERIYNVCKARYHYFVGLAIGTWSKLGYRTADC